MRGTLAKGLIITGVILLGVVVSLHLYLGVPPIVAGMEASLIQDAPGMAGTELLAIWICFSVIFYCLLGGILIQLVRGAVNRLFVGATGLAALASAMTMLIYHPGVHPAVWLLTPPALALLIGAKMAES